MACAWRVHGVCMARTTVTTIRNSAHAPTRVRAWPELDDAYAHASHWLLGEGLVVAPVTTPLAAAAPLSLGHLLWVPPGSWVQRHTGLLLRGPVRLRQSVALDEVPLLHAAGSVVFGQAHMQYVCMVRIK